MNWFRKLSQEKCANHFDGKLARSDGDCSAKKLKNSLKCCRMKNDKDNNKKKVTITVNLKKSNSQAKAMSSLSTKLIEVVDPEHFFHDPDHVRNYKEEEAFLRIMSEWEIVELPGGGSAIGNGNFFSADFEDELIQMKIHEYCQDMNTSVTTTGSSNSLTTICFPIMNNDKKCRRTLCQVFFGYDIQTGIAIPGNINCLGNSYKRVKLEDDHSDHESEFYVKPSSSLNVCSKKVNKDCQIDRSQLKTEALARSIMGAIGMCPGKDSTLPPDLQQSAASSDLCHPPDRSTCDHYDIKHFFRLDDYGNILLNINHIVEFKGYGFAVAQNRRLHRKYLKAGYSAVETYARQRGILDMLRHIIRFLWYLIIGHPRNKISAYGGPGDSVRSYTLQLASDQTSTFSRNIENFISCTKESREAAPQVVMRNMRQFMNGMKNYLVKHGEGKFHQEVETARSRLKSDEFLNLDAILETVMHQLIVLPLREHLYGMFVDYYTRSEDIQLLAQNVKYACGRSATDFGIRASVAPPSSTSLHLISNLLLRLQEAELPLEKLDLFLCIISAIFDATGCPRGQQLGADDFLPVLVYVVAKCGFVGAEIEAEFMWGLLQPTLLNGEPGYYLTALCSAVHVLKSFMASDTDGTGSLDWRSSSLPACSSVLRVIIPDECNGSLQTRTLPVRPHTTTREVCRIIAHKARITNPQDYALFKLVDGEETLLTDIECPQDIRLAAKGKHCMLAYKRIDAKIAWPTATQPSYS